MAKEASIETNPILTNEQLLKIRNELFDKILGEASDKDQENIKNSVSSSLLKHIYDLDIRTVAFFDSQAENLETSLKQDPEEGSDDHKFNVYINSITAMLRDPEVQNEFDELQKEVAIQNISINYGEVGFAKTGLNIKDSICLFVSQCPDMTLEMRDKIEEVVLRILEEISKVETVHRVDYKPANPLEVFAASLNILPKTMSRQDTQRLADEGNETYLNNLLAYFTTGVIDILNGIKSSSNYDYIDELGVIIDKLEDTIDKLENNESKDITLTGRLAITRAVCNTIEEDQIRLSKLFKELASSKKVDQNEV